MKLYVGADHGGFELKKKVVAILKEKGHDVVDLGAHEYDKLDDFPDFGAPVAEKVSRDPEGARGILLCRSGVGMDIVANRHPNVRSVLGFSADHVARARHDEDVNVLCVAGDFVPEAEAMKMVDAFLSTSFATEEKYSRRLGKIDSTQ